LYELIFGLMKLGNGKMTVIICSAVFCSYRNVSRLEIMKRFRYWK
jgi:hypothetical protein